MTQIKPLLYCVAITLLLSTQVVLAKSKTWTNTSPAINATHIFKGEINRKGKPTGYHAKFNGKKVKGAKIERIRSKPNKAGVYTAEVAIFDEESKHWKSKFSSMFPDSMSARDVIDAILHAYKHREKGKSKPWRGPSGHGFPIEGYLLRNGKINTAYPIYIRDRK